MVAIWGQAKIEFIALRGEIFDEHGKGKSRHRIYHDLRVAGRITMSKRSFYFWFNTLLSSPSSISLPKSVLKASKQVTAPVSSLPRRMPSPSGPSNSSTIEGRMTPVSLEFWDDDTQPNEAEQ
ncbi:hypothetical protein [Thalassospira sp.]|uniref:hypothetical protein n=1 Tax=Thalassospira sp. TaxID=1912094 RepID=UPI002732483D|nr:hypothetical protein [Thalassospira sp.]MDP2699944.1 hypothetical protein [Thalassospira sp.]